jgi:hypothetical protein
MIEAAVANLHYYSDIYTTEAEENYENSQSG